jgi:hypothetical protein
VSRVAASFTLRSSLLPSIHRERDVRDCDRP